MRTLAMMMTIALSLTAAACGSNYEAPPATSGDAAGGVATPHDAPAVGQPGVPPGSGRVLETMNSGGYTYVNVDLGGTPTWVAGPEVKVGVGDVVTVPGGMAMRGYHSKTLDRTFDLVWFVGGIQTSGAEAITQDLGGSERSHVDATGVAAGSVERVAGGKTVEEVVTGAADLSGQEVVLRGKVVKFNAAIMGTNWLHVQDGSGSGTTADLTVTTSATVDVGDVVVVRGKVTTDKDFGAGYRYAVIIEDAAVTKE